MTLFESRLTLRNTLGFLVFALVGCSGNAEFGRDSSTIAGSQSTGGSPGAGGSSGVGGSTDAGGAPSPGGSPATGGALGAGGVTNTGGAPSPGGSPATGGALGVGGATNTGGAPATGGSTGPGGSSGTDPIAQACRDGGGTVTTSLCCSSLTSEFPNNCSIGACSCAPQSSKTVRVCICPTNACFDGHSCVEQF